MLDGLRERRMIRCSEKLLSKAMAGSKFSEKSSHEVDQYNWRSDFRESNENYLTPGWGGGMAGQIKGILVLGPT